MSGRKKLEDAEIESFLAEKKATWTRTAHGAIERTFKFEAYRDGVAFAVAVAMVADQKDHHPDLFLGYGRVQVRWSTHDAGGITALDRELANLSDQIAARHGGA